MVKRKIQRQVKLPPFRCDVAAFVTLIDDLCRHCDQGGAANVAITVGFEHEELKFDTAGELLEFPWARDSISKVGVLVWPEDYRGPDISLRLGDSYELRGTISATSDSEGWNAGATEIGLAFARRHRRWYPASRSVAMIPLFATVVALSMAMSHWFGVSPGSATYYIFLGPVAVLVGRYAFDATDWLFPGATIVVRDHERLLRRYSVEITVALGIATLAVALLAWLFPITHG